MPSGEGLVWKTGPVMVVMRTMMILLMTTRRMVTTCMMMSIAGLRHQLKICA